MTSTSFNIGLTSSEKNSSRVLRPPGGGHSDIFGIRDNQNELVTPSKKRNYPQSTIGSCFNMVDEKKQETKPEENGNLNPILNEETSKDDGKNEVDNGTDENKAPGENGEEKPEPMKEQSNPTSRRTRVPPGGFSSGLW